jgi:hypothetical protein
VVGVAGSIVSYHVRLAVAIAALAPELRLASVLALTWSENIDADFRFISVRRHKTVTRVRRPQAVPISGDVGFIRTVHGFGYAFAGEARDVGSPVVESARHWILCNGRESLLAEGEHLIGRDPDVAITLTHRASPGGTPRLSLQVT